MSSSMTTNSSPANLITVPMDSKTLFSMPASEIAKLAGIKEIP